MEIATQSRNRKTILLFLLATEGILEIQGIYLTVKVCLQSIVNFSFFFLRVHVLWLQCDIFVISNESQKWRHIFFKIYFYHIQDWFADKTL